MIHSATTDDTLQHNVVVICSNANSAVVIHSTTKCDDTVTDSTTKCDDTVTDTVTKRDDTVTDSTTTRDDTMTDWSTPVSYTHLTLPTSSYV